MLNIKSDPDKSSPLGSNEVSNGGMARNAIVRVESAAGEGLDELFKAVINGNGSTHLPQQIPMRQRRLPPSFFRPPSATSSTNSVNHSRESSLDGGYQSGQTPATDTTVGNGTNKITNPVISYTNNGLAIIHPRANSSPAALQPANLNGVSNGLAFASNELKNSNVVDNGANSVVNGVHFRQMSYDINSIRLPDGWEMSFTPSGERYFLNHKEKTTTWEDPRKLIVEDMIRRSTGNLHSSQTQPIIQSSLGHQQVPDQENLDFCDPTTVPLPEGWEQASTASGDIYFISHLDQSTTWFHPNIPRNLQQKRVQEQQQQNQSSQPPPFQSNSNIPPELVVALKNMNCQTPTTTDNPLEQALKSQQNNQNLRDLELERERMRQRQEELMQNNLLSNNSNILLSSATEPAPSPFLRNDCHSRQESADSGLDLGNSNNYSMPHTPDDFLRINSANGNTNTNGTGASFGGALSDDIAFDNIPISGIDLDSESMDFMQGVMDMDLLSNVEELLNSNKDNIMTWL